VVDLPLILHRTCAYLLLVVSALLAAHAPQAAANEPLDFYVGGAIGQSRVDASAEPITGRSSDTFGANHAGFKVMIGMRAFSLLGTELAYIDFGHPNGTLESKPADLNMKGAAAFGVLYLPVPIVDIYAKAGLARIQSRLNGYAPEQPACVPCAPVLFALDRTNTGFAAGAGAQYRMGAWAVRAEYERFNAGGGNPSLLSAGVTRSLF
jgi:opacity protein-like surface antigen